MLASNFRGVFTFLVARLLGRAALGTFTIAWNFTDLASKLAVFGLGDSVSAFIARADASGDHERSRAVFRAGVALALGIGALLVTIGLVALLVLGPRVGEPPEVVRASTILLCALPAMAVYKVATGASRGKRVMRHDVYSRGMTEPAATTAAFLIALALGARESAPAIAALAGTAASGIVAARLAAGLFRGAAEEPSTARPRFRLGELLTFSAPIAGYDLLNTLVLNLDIVMLGWFVDRAAGVTLASVGVYAAASDVASGIRKVSQSFNPIFVPVVAAMAAGGERARAAATYARLARWMLAALLPLIAVMVLAGGAVLSIYGSSFRAGHLWVAILAVACATNAFVSLGEVVLMVERPRLNLLNSAAAAIVAIAANLWLIPRIGLTGAAIAVLLPHVLQGILRAAELRWLFGWRSRWRELAHPILAASVAAAPAVAVRLLVGGLGGQLAAALAFLAAYVAVWWRLGLDAADRAILNELTGRQTFSAAT